MSDIQEQIKLAHKRAEENDYYFKKNNELSSLNTSLRSQRDELQERNDNLNNENNELSLENQRLYNLLDKIKKLINHYAVEDEDYSKIYNQEEQDILELLEEIE